MKTYEEIYANIRDIFLKKSNVSIQRGTALDYFTLASAELINEAYKEIENNKTPHIYTSLKGQQLDDMAILLGLSRREDETDKNFLYRIIKHNTSNKASNLTAIETALMNMTHVSHVTYSPHAFGCGTAAAYIIPKSMDDTNKELAISETKERLKNVVSPSTYIEYIIPKIVNINLTILIKTTNADSTNIKANITDKIIKYINGIAPGDALEIGELNRIGNTENNVTYFNIGHVFIDKKETGQVSILQKVESKFLISEKDINWMEVE